MSKISDIARRRSAGLGKAISFPRNRRAAKVKRVTGFIQHHFDGVRIKYLCRIDDIGRQRRYARLPLARQGSGDLAYGCGRNQRFIALQVDDNLVIGPSTKPCDFGDPFRTAVMVGTRHHRLNA